MEDYGGDGSRPEPAGFPSFASGVGKLEGLEPLSRGGLFDSQQLIGSLVDAQSTRVPSSGVGGLGVTQSEFLRGSGVLDASTEEYRSLKRPDANILAFVDRASFPGFTDPENAEERDLQLVRDGYTHHLSQWRSSPAAAPSVMSPNAARQLQSADNAPGRAAVPRQPANGSVAITTEEEWERELIDWKIRYGCQLSEAEQQAAAGWAKGDNQVQDSATASASLPRLHTSTETGSHTAGQASASTPADLQGAYAQTTLLERSPGDVSDLGWLSREPWPAGASLPAEVGPISPPLHGLEEPIQNRRQEKLSSWQFESEDLHQSFSKEEANKRADIEEAVRSLPVATLSRALVREVEPPASAPSNASAMAPVSPVADLALAPPPFPLESVAPGSDQAATASPGGFGAFDAFAPPPFPLESSVAASNSPGDTSRIGAAAGMPLDASTGALQLVADVPAVAPSASASTTLALPAQPASRKNMYTQEDLDIATSSAKKRLLKDGTYNTEYSEAGIQMRDFFVDLRKQRAKDKGRQATGPIWIHLAAQAKNLSSSFGLPEILESMKLFCSVRYEDYELYMRLLGEVPHYVKLANADQLCELIRLLARRRLRERNYVDMIAAHLLQKIRITDDSLPARLLVKAANSFAALECRSQPKFVEHFLRHMEHRIEELDGEICCLVSPLFVANYMTDSLRRAFLKRCAETQAGFHGGMDLLRNLACIELVMRKEHHSFMVSLPSYVTRFLEKVRKHAEFDGWGAVTLPPAVAPDGPKGSHRSEMSLSLQRKATTAPSSVRGDVFNSDMHRDVSACLNHLGIEHENGVLCGPFLLDIVALDMVNPSKRLVYEVNSPHHYYEGTETIIAEKRLRHRMLGRLNQKLHMVHAHDWRGLSAAQRMTFMLKLQQAQQDENTVEAKRQAAANTMRIGSSPAAAAARMIPAPPLMPALPFDVAKKPEPFRLKSARKPGAPPLRVPTPPSQRNRPPLTAR